uniref:signal peptidase I n=1 Tax=Allofournierella sp. TaxID=1940256 RepID=UPI003AB12C01
MSRAVKTRQRLAAPPQKLFNAIVAVLGAALTVFFLPLLILNTIIVVNSYLHPDKVPDAFGFKPFIVLSGSMEPNIMTGDLVITREVDPAGLQVGDVIAFREGQSVITHRIIETQQVDGQRQFVTKGDNNNTQDSRLVPYSAVEGKYLMRISSLGDFAMFLQTPVGLILFVGVPLIGFIIYDILRRKFIDTLDTQENARLRAELEALRAGHGYTPAPAGVPAGAPTGAWPQSPQQQAQRPAPAPQPQRDRSAELEELLRRTGGRPAAQRPVAQPPQTAQRPQPQTAQTPPRPAA